MSSTKISDIPPNIVIRHILSKIDINNFHRLFDSSILLNNYTFIADYLLPTYLFIKIDNSNTNVNDDIIFRNKIIIYIIENFNYYNFISFINTIELPIIYEELYNIDNIWNIIIKRNDINILNYFIKECDDCKWEVFNAASLLNNQEIMIEIIQNNYYYPTFENYLLILINNQVKVWNYIIYNLINNIEYKKYLYNEVYEYIILIKNDINIYDNICQYLYSISNLLYSKNINNNWIKEQLYIFENILECSSLVENISNYIIIIDIQEEINIDEEIDDYDY